MSSINDHSSNHIRHGLSKSLHSITEAGIIIIIREKGENWASHIVFLYPVVVHLSVFILNCDWTSTSSGTQATYDAGTHNISIYADRRRLHPCIYSLSSHLQNKDYFMNERESIPTTTTSTTSNKNNDSNHLTSHRHQQPIIHDGLLRLHVRRNWLISRHPTMISWQLPAWASGWSSSDDKRWTMLPMHFECNQRWAKEMHFNN